MKKYLVTALALVLALCACNKNNTEPQKVQTVVGQWQLSSISTKAASIGSETVEVYLEFIEGGSFNIYQVIGTGRPRAYSGSWELSDGLLSGKYSDGKKWGATYAVSFSGSNLVLTNSSGGESDTYAPATIPQSVRDEAI